MGCGSLHAVSLLYVSVYVCMYVCIYIYTYIYIYIHMYMIYGNINMHIIQGLGVRAAQDLSIR